MPHKRPIYQKAKMRLNGPRKFMQVLAGPRQVGKTTLAHQLKDSLSIPSHYASADEPTLRTLGWIEQQWEIGRRYAEQEGSTKGALLILDEVQRIPEWSVIVKKLWDQDSAKGIKLQVMLLGSSTLLIQTGLAENLGGRFELLPATHWSFNECQSAFGLTLDEFIYFGSYPGAISLIEDQSRWARYIIDSIIETSFSRDVLLTTRVHRPILLRRLFELGCHYSGSILSYQQILGQLQDSGNAHTLAQYLHLLEKSGLVAGLQKFSSHELQQKASSPKIQVLNTALMSAPSHYSFKEAKQKREFWNKLLESAIGAHLLNSSYGTDMEIYYWKDGGKEVDFIIKKGDSILPIQTNISYNKSSLSSIEAFTQKFHPQKKLIIGEGGMPLDEFLLTSLDSLI